jgi:hypothetical protein
VRSTDFFLGAMPTGEPALCGEKPLREIVRRASMPDGVARCLYPLGAARSVFTLVVKGGSRLAQARRLLPDLSGVLERLEGSVRHRKFGEDH